MKKKLLLVVTILMLAFSTAVYADDGETHGTGGDTQGTGGDTHSTGGETGSTKDGETHTGNFVGGTDFDFLIKGFFDIF